MTGSGENQVSVQCCCTWKVKNQNDPTSAVISECSFTSVMDMFCHLEQGIPGTSCPVCMLLMLAMDLSNPDLTE
jgi:hypothetical protein